MKRFTFTLIGLLLTGCGGGGGGDTSSPSTTTPPAQPAPVAKDKKMADLQTTKQFEFDSNYTLTLVLPSNTDSSHKYFVNVCTEFGETDPIISDYSSCKIRGYLGDSSKTYELKLSDSERDLVAQIWPMYPGAEVRTVYFTATANNQTWRLSN